MGVSPIIDMEKGGESPTNPSDGDEKADQHRNCQRDGEVDGEVGPVDRRRGQKRAGQRKGERDRGIAGEVVDEGALGDFHEQGSVPVSPHRSKKKTKKPRKR